MHQTRIQHADRQGGGWRRGVGAGLIGGLALVWWASSTLSPPSEASAETVRQGRELFLHEWRSTSPGAVDRDPLVAATGDGLGPVFNARSCVACHSQPGVGGAGENKQSVLTFDVVPTRTNPKFTFGVVHASADSERNLESAADVNRIFPIVQGEQRRLGGCTITIPDFNPVNFTRINPPALFGAGEIQRISGQAIRGQHRARQLLIYPQELKGSFTATPAGRPRVLSDGRIGKFGWKAQFASLEDFVASACAVELGLSNPRRKQDRPHQQGEDQDAELDMSGEQLIALTAYTAAIPRPVQILPEDQGQRLEVEHGRRLFETIGCADCHTPNLDGIAGIYSDLLLHKLEDDREGNGYGRLDPNQPVPEGQPLPNEWKTPPLWGVADSAPYFHDGASPNLESAILRHRGQGRHVTDRYQALSPEQRRNLIQFLESLRAPSTEAAPVRENVVAANERR